MSFSLTSIAHASIVLPLFDLPAALLPSICYHLSPKDLLTTLALTAKAVRDRLSAVLFSSHPLELTYRELSLLSTQPPSVTSRSFHLCVFADSRLVLRLETREQSSSKRLSHSTTFPHAERSACRARTTRGFISATFSSTGFSTIPPCCRATSWDCITFSAVSSQSHRMSSIRAPGRSEGGGRSNEKPSSSRPCRGRMCVSPS